MNISQLLTKLKALIYSKSETDSLLGGKANSSHTHTKSQITDFPSLATVATSGSYTDLSNKPTIPTVNNKTLTIQKNGTTVKTFTANSNTDVTANITVPTKVSELTNDSGFLTSSGSCNYANSAGNSDTLDGYHEYSFLRNRGATSTSGEGTFWTQIGIKEYHNALPDGLSGVYQWGEVVSLAGTNSRFDIYCSHESSNGNGLYYRSGWNDDKKDWRCFIDSANIGSQSVNYANSAEWANRAGQADYLGDIGSTDRNGASGTGWYSVGFSYSYDEGYNELAINNYWGIRINCRDSSHVTINGNRIIDSGNTGNISISGYQVYVG